MSQAVLTLSITFGLLLVTFVFATHMTLYQDYKYYKPTYKLLYRLNDGTKIKKYGNQLTIKLDNTPEIIFFGDNGAIKINHAVYIHGTFYELASPYAMYYKYKFKKLLPHLIYLYHRAHREEDMFGRYLSETQLTKTKVLSFKFFRGQ